MSEQPPFAPPPAGYTLIRRFLLFEQRAFIWLNIAAVAIFMLALALILGLLLGYQRLGAPLVIAGLPDALPMWAYFALLVGTLLLHEALHGLAMWAYGGRPRFGIKITRLVLFTTSNAFFTRQAYLTVSLAPLVGISAFGLPLMFILPGGVAIWIGIIVAMNIASSVGDLWMAAVIVRYPPDTLFRDEATGMSIFAPES